LKEILEENKKNAYQLKKNTRMPKKFPKDYSRKIKIGFDSISLTSEVSQWKKKIQFDEENSSLDV